MRPGFSPLDEELELLPGSLSPVLAEGVARLGTWMPFAAAAELLAFFWRVSLSEPTVRRHAQAAGAAWVAVQTAQVERLEQEQPDGPPGPPLSQVSVDGAMVPLVGGQWAEAKTVAVGRVQAVPQVDGPPQVHTSEWSYFSRLADVGTFTRLAWGELHGRGIETAGTVVAPVDGSQWCQAFLDHHRPDAVRILDFPHALQHLAQAAQATFGPGTEQTSTWLGQQAHTLKHDDPEDVLTALRALPVGEAGDVEAATAARDATLAYLEKRREQIQYAQFVTLGYPIGSGSVESANKLVVEARLKGSGMHWAPEHVDPMLALRTITCSDRWSQAWPRISAQLRAQERQRRLQRWHERHPTPNPAPPQPPPPAPLPQRQTHGTSLRPPTIVNGRPTADHPWKKRPCLSGGRSRPRL